MLYQEMETLQVRKSIPDSKRIVHKHLNDPEHVITDEDILSVRISVDLPDYLIKAFIQSPDIYFSKKGS